MKTFKNLKSILNEEWKDVIDSLEKKVAGVCIIYENKILLVHPTNASWQKRTLGIPKGKVETGEDVLTGAIRELKEETGISLNPSILSRSEPYVCNTYNKKGDIEKQLIYFLHEVTSLSEIGMTSLRISNDNLQKEEIDWAGFLSADEAYPKISKWQLIVLDRHLNK